MEEEQGRGWIVLAEVINELNPIREENKAKRTEEKRAVKGLEVFMAPKRECSGIEAKN